MSYNFDRVSDQYDATRGWPPGVAERVCRWVLARLPADPAITEIGVGTGRVALPFVLGGVRYSGLDLSQQMMQVLRDKLGGDLRRAQLLVADATQPLPLPDGSQDAVLAVHVLHLMDPVVAVRQIRRALKPHGALVWGFDLHDEQSPRFRVRGRFFELVNARGIPRRDFFAQAAREELARMGAQVTRHTVTTWQQTETCREVLDGMRSRSQSSTWHLDDETLRVAADAAEAFARETYGDLDRPIDLDQRFTVDWYQF